MRATFDSDATNRWSEHILTALDDDVIRTRAELPAEPIESVAHFDMWALKREIDNRLKRIYLPTAQDCAILKQLVSLAASHYAKNYSSIRAFNERVQESGADDAYSDSNAVLLTGLAGGGKTALFAALSRILQPFKLFFIEENGLTIPCRPVLTFKLASNSAEKHLVAEALSILGGQRFSQRTTIAEFQERLINLLFVCGVAILGLDELQFLSKSEGSIQKAVSFLIDSLKLGVPVVYCANYSLVHRLMDRPSEDKQRLLSSVLELYPEASDSPDWIRLLIEVKKVAPRIFVFDPVVDAERIFRWTAGLRRMLRFLLVAGYEQVSGDKAPQVTRDVLERAYKSASYTSNRRDVVAIIRLGIQPSNKKEYASIRSPFPKETKALAFHASLNEARLKQATEIAAQSSMTHHEQRAYLDASTSTERAMVKPLRDTRNAQTSAERVAATQRLIDQDGKVKRP